VSDELSSKGKTIVDEVDEEDGVVDGIADGKDVIIDVFLGTVFVLTKKLLNISVNKSILYLLIYI